MEVKTSSMGSKNCNMLYYLVLPLEDAPAPGAGKSDDPIYTTPPNLTGYQENFEKWCSI